VPGGVTGHATRAGEVAVAREGEGTPQRAFEVSSIPSREAIANRAAHHGLAEEGTRIEAVTITPFGIFAPVVESHAMLVVGVRLAGLTPVPTREAHALSVDPAKLSFPLNVGGTNPELGQLTEPARDPALLPLGRDDRQLPAFDLADGSGAFPVGLLLVEQVTRAAFSGRTATVGAGSQAARVGAVRWVGGVDGVEWVDATGALRTAGALRSGPAGLRKGRMRVAAGSGNAARTGGCSVGAITHMTNFVGSIAGLGVISAKDGVGSRVIHRIALSIVPIIRGIAPGVGLVGRGGVGGHHQESSSWPSIGSVISRIEIKGGSDITFISTVSGSSIQSESAVGEPRFHASLLGGAEGTISGADEFDGPSHVRRTGDELGGRVGMADQTHQGLVLGRGCHVTRGGETRLTLGRRRAIGEQLANAGRFGNAEEMTLGAFGDLGVHDPGSAIAPDAGIGLFRMANVDALIGASGMQGVAIRLQIERGDNRHQQKGNEDEQASHRPIGGGDRDQ